jgi:hypothetical protein
LRRRRAAEDVIYGDDGRHDAGLGMDDNERGRADPGKKIRKVWRRRKLLIEES